MLGSVRLHQVTVKTTEVTFFYPEVECHGHQRGCRTVGYAEFTSSQAKKAKSGYLGDKGTSVGKEAGLLDQDSAKMLPRIAMPEQVNDSQFPESLNLAFPQFPIFKSHDNNPFLHHLYIDCKLPGAGPLT